MILIKDIQSCSAIIRVSNPESELMLEAQHVAAQRGPVTLFSDVNFALGSGEALIVTGAVPPGAKR